VIFILAFLTHPSLIIFAVILSSSLTLRVVETVRGFFLFFQGQMSMFDAFDQAGNGVVLFHIRDPMVQSIHLIADITNQLGIFSVLRNVHLFLETFETINMFTTGKKVWIVKEVTTNWTSESFPGDWI